MRKKIREPPNVIRVLLYMMLELHNIRKKPLNVRKKEKKKKPSNVTRIVTCNVGSA